MNTPEEQVYLVYKSLYTAMINEDVDRINQLMMEGSFLVHMTGYKQPKREWLKAIEDQSMKYFSSLEENIEIMMKDKKATLIAQNRVDANINGMRDTWPLELTIYMVKFEKNWMISHIDARAY
ncbi:nuclear transport factor 2 family protein [Macrococcus sp. EM39E]|uniref:nuclear transport factor 2 family protein n=1 Tax=Macrococcus animalis TaxID=3395467 RepID=UPI0039BDECE3